MEAAPLAAAAGADLIVAGGDIVTMNRERDVVVDGAVAIAAATHRWRSAGPPSCAPRHPGAAVLDATGCVVTPGLVDAHRHLTGDPLVRSCIPDRLPHGESIFEWAVPIHAAHDGADDELSATLAAVESLTNGTTTDVEAGTVAHPDRVAKAAGDGRHPGHDRHVGLGRRATARTPRPPPRCWPARRRSSPSTRPAAWSRAG